MFQLKTMSKEAEKASYSRSNEKYTVVPLIKLYGIKYKNWQTHIFTDMGPNSFVSEINTEQKHDFNKGTYFIIIWFIF